MSLETAAKHLASKGRGPDTQLVHMSLGELSSLQELAKAHGGSLSINPDTGLPEAGFLDSLLPAIIGGGLMFATGGLGAAAMPGLFGLGMPATIGLGVGALQTARTGDLGKGIMAGLGAYGGAGLAGGLAAAGTQAAANSAIAGDLASTVGEPALAATQAAQAAQATPLSTMGQGAKSLFTDAGAREAFMSNVGGGKGLLKYAAGAAAPMMAGEEQTNIPTQSSSQPQLFSYSPNRVEDPRAGYPEDYRGEYAYFRPQYTRLAEGGLADLSPGVERYALGGFFNRLKNREAGAATGQYAYDPATQSYASGLGGLSGAYNYTYDPTTQSYTSVAPPPAAAETAGVAEYQPTYGQVDYGAGMASGGISHLGDYSDGGRLLRGPGDGVSDSIPATIGNKRPARLADNEFVIPARIVSEIGNGSSEAGARRLYAMMDRVQARRAKTVGKGKVAVDSKAYKEVERL